ncbi:hypothetical protein TNCV_3693761 [Trichonephila clavipes]|nr:hypothetical protein TNCV_3693761 [Trichonephila clavipes]
MARESLGDQFLPPTNLGPVDEEMVPPEALEHYNDRCPPVVCKILDITSRLYSKGFDIVCFAGYQVTCFRCQSYGHGTACSRGVATCNKCSSTEHASKACTAERRKCSNCKGEHAPYSKICPKWQQEKEIQRIKVLENLSYSEARKRVVNILPPRASSCYANAVMTNTKSKKDTATQTEISHIETPTNIDNLISESHKDSPLAQKPITIVSWSIKLFVCPLETSSMNLESLNLDKRSPETSHLSVPSDTEVLMEIDKSSTKRPATDIVKEAAKILKPSIRIESGGIQTTKELEDIMLLSKKWKIKRRSYSPIKYDSEKPKGSP